MPPFVEWVLIQLQAEMAKLQQAVIPIEASVFADVEENGDMLDPDVQSNIPASHRP